MEIPTPTQARGYQTGREAPAEIERQNRRLVHNPLVEAIVRNAPFFVGVLNSSRQFVAVNDRFFPELGMADAQEYLGMRPGEVFGCVHHKDSPGGCGEGEACRYCGVVATVVAALRTGEPQAAEARIVTGDPRGPSSLDLQVTARPLEVDGRVFVLLFIHDIGPRRRKELLERIFFHDILNSATLLESLARLASEVGREEATKNDLVKLQTLTASDIVEQIRFQQKLAAAESGDLTPEKEMVNLDKEILDIVAAFDAKRRIAGVGTLLEVEAEPTRVPTDPVLVRRIVTNMIKNAVEAAEGGPVKVRLTTDGGFVRVSVTNAAVMSAEVKAQVFQHSYSTKGRDRGIGTYSMRYLAGRYLGGDVRFESREGDGTTFTLELPLGGPA